MASVWPVILIGLLACFVMASSLDVLALGERAAQHSGVNVERLRAVSIAATALLTGAAVAYAGIIAFIGLIHSSPVAHDFGSVESCVVAGFGIGWRAVDCAV